MLCYWVKTKRHLFEVGISRNVSQTRAFRNFPTRSSKKGNQLSALLLIYASMFCAHDVKLHNGIQWQACKEVENSSK